MAFIFKSDGLFLTGNFLESYKKI